MKADDLIEIHASTRPAPSFVSLDEWVNGPKEILSMFLSSPCYHCCELYPATEVPVVCRQCGNYTRPVEP